MIDIPLELEQELERMAEQLSVPFSQLINRLAYEGWQVISIDQLREELQPSRSMRYSYNLPLPGKRGKRNR